MAKTDFKSVDQYMSTLPEEVRSVLEAVRLTIRKVIPGGEESISYQIPVVKINGKYIIYFAGWKDHISLYPIPEVDDKFKEKLAPFIKGKGTLSFPLDKPMPLDLVARIVKFSLKGRGF